MTNKKIPKGKGWHRHPDEHALASKGIKTKMSSHGRDEENKLSRDEEMEVFRKFFSNEKIQNIMYDFYSNANQFHDRMAWYINENYDVYATIDEFDPETDSYYEVERLVKIETTRHDNKIFVDIPDIRNLVLDKSYFLDIREDILPPYTEPGAHYVEGFLESNKMYNEDVHEKLSKKYVDKYVDDFERWMGNLITVEFAEKYMYYLEDEGYTFVRKDGKEPMIESDPASKYTMYPR